MPIRVKMHSESTATVFSYFELFYFILSHHTCTLHKGPYLKANDSCCLIMHEDYLIPTSVHSTDLPLLATQLPLSLPVYTIRYDTLFALKN